MDEFAGGHLPLQDQKGPDYYAHCRQHLVDWLPSPLGRCLEVGCSSGATLKYMRDRGAVYVAGIDINEQALLMADGAGADCVLRLDIEGQLLPFEAASFDAIVLGDVLEHLRDPWTVLQKLTVLLKRGGHMSISFPNVAFYKVLWPLIFHDRWEYVSAGVLDSTHLRFFTAREMSRAVSSCGLTIVAQDSVRAPGWKARCAEIGSLGVLRRFFISQYLFLAKKE